MNKTSPCCKAKIVKKKRENGQILIDCCGKCGRKIHPGNKIVTRERAQQLNSDVMKRLQIKRKKVNALADAFGVPGPEFYDALDYLAAKNKKKI